MLVNLVAACMLAGSADIPTIALASNGALDEVRWHNRELLCTATGDRRATVVFAHVVSVEGDTVRYRMVESGSDVQVRFIPVENGLDVHVTVDGAGREDVEVYLGQFGYQGQIRALHPAWAGHIKDIIPLDEMGERYPYPGRGFVPVPFAPVYALWDSQHTIGFAAMTNVGEAVDLQLWPTQSTTPAAQLNIGLVDACEAGVHKEFDLTIRFSEGAAQWREVLRPYQQHQALRDGPVRYDRLGPMTAHNMRNNHAYDYWGTRDFEPGSTWENTLGEVWNDLLELHDDRNLNIGCIGVWAQMEQLEDHLEFNPDALDLEQSLDGSLPDLIDRIHDEHPDIPVLAFVRPSRKIVTGQIQTRDLSDPAEWNQAMAQLQGLGSLGFDLAYGDEIGAHGSWESVDLAEASPVRIVAEWSWDRLMTRASCLSVHPMFPANDAALLIPYLTPGGELYASVREDNHGLFRGGVVTPWTEWLGDHNRSRFNAYASYVHADGSLDGADNAPDDLVRNLSLMWEGIGDPGIGPRQQIEPGEMPDQPDDPNELMTLLVERQTDDKGDEIGPERIVRLIHGGSKLTLEEVQEYITRGTSRIVVNRRRDLLSRLSSDDDDQDDGDGDGDDPPS
ncbi:MAG: hypothetical protein KAS72_13280 [Phycisphaerales bacterium]|nr:hypothetical protein [Phycisphaerales bacterium]